MWLTSIVSLLTANRKCWVSVIGMTLCWALGLHSGIKYGKYLYISRIKFNKEKTAQLVLTTWKHFESGLNYQQRAGLWSI